MHFFPTKKTEFVGDWLFRVSLLVVRNRVRPTFRHPETFMKTTVLYIVKDRNDAGWSLTDHCMYLMSFFGILWLVLILFTQMVTEPRSQGPPLHGGRVGEDPGNEADSYHLTYWPYWPYCLVTSFISVLRRSAWWEIMGLLDVRLVTFILSLCHFERYVKE